MLSWCLNAPTNCLRAPCPGVQLYQCDKTGLYHKFLFLSSPDCGLVMFKCTNKIPSHFLLVYLTLTQIKPLAHGSLLSPISPLPWLRHLSTMAPIGPLFGMLCLHLLRTMIIINPLTLYDSPSIISAAVLRWSLKTSQGRLTLSFWTHCSCLMDILYYFKGVFMLLADQLDLFQDFWFCFAF